MQIVADNNIPFVNKIFSSIGEVQLVPGRSITNKLLQNADILLVRSVTPVNHDLLKGSKVQFIATATIGTDHVNTDDLRSLGIGFSNAAGSNANSVAEYVIAALLEMGKRQRIRLSDQTLGIIGLGNIGSKVARYGKALGMRVLENDPPRQQSEQLPHFCSIDTILAEADIITLHVPLTRDQPDATYHLFNEKVFASLGKQPILVNSARGQVVDNKALLTAISEGKLRGTVLDVWENEPAISKDLLQEVDIGTPHIAGYSLDGKLNGTKMIYESTCKYFGVKPDLSSLEKLLPISTIQPVQFDLCNNADSEACARKAVQACYSIMKDDSALRDSPDQFDLLRANYPTRREFSNTRFLDSNLPNDIRKMLRVLGFNFM